MLLTAGTASAQSIQFETTDYAGLSAYDSWEASPLRKGLIEGNCMVVDNPFTEESDPATGASLNSSAKVLGFERSVLGSIHYGARIDLTEEQRFELTTTTKFIHVMTHTPKAGRMMCIGLGKRQNRPGQSREVEQFFVESRVQAVAGQWFDAVFPIKGNGGIDIYSIVIVPDLASTHDLADDFVAYFDDIVVNNSGASRLLFGDYPLSFDKNAEQTRSDRYTTSVAINGSSYGNKTIEIEKRPYNDLTASDQMFEVKPGDVITPVLGYKGTWMSGYVYIDFGNDGKFGFDINEDGTPADGSDIITYSFYNGKNSKGQNVANGNVIAQPSYTVPKDVKEGIYRIRFKVDWADLDPAGNCNDGNMLIANGGCVVDALVKIHGDEVTLNAQQLNGDVQSSDGVNLENTKAASGKPYTIKMAPAPGFAYDGIKVRYGFNLQGDSVVHGNRQWYEKTFLDNLFNLRLNTFELPAEVMSFGNVNIEGLFVDEKYKKRHVNVTYRLREADGSVIKETDIALEEGQPFPDADFSELFTCGRPYYVIKGEPEGTVGKNDTILEMTYENNLPFELTTGTDDLRLYNLTIGPDKEPLYYSTTKIKCPATKEPENDAKIWFFMGDVRNGITICNYTKGTEYILSASTTMTGKEGAGVYPHMIKAPVKDIYNTYWAVTEGEEIGGERGFFLSQKGFPDQTVNVRNSYVAFWTGGTDENSTFLVNTATTGIDRIASTTTADNAIFNLAGQKVQTAEKNHIYIKDGKKVVF